MHQPALNYSDPLYNFIVYPAWINTTYDMTFIPYSNVLRGILHYDILTDRVTHLTVVGYMDWATLKSLVQYHPGVCKNG